MKTTTWLRTGVAGMLILAAAAGCKKSADDIVPPPTAEEQRQAEIESVRTFLVKKYQMKNEDVGFDQKNKYFSMHQINVLSYEDALIEYQAIKK
ncbi:hypothetical protein ECE50_000585 [Chitinophaga sp. Mgbs1]|uniref:Uncharacterized protein n=1 Tax=Chitinophaga solisilvae TaxID=1233460 RepID=A0A433W9H5_9BACT|nr:hypothetical protein [Chitinophaga solisilvae]